MNAVPHSSASARESVILLVHIRAANVQEGGRKHPIFSGYRATWSLSVEDDVHSAYHDAALVILGRESIRSGEEAYGYIVPLNANAWIDVSSGQEIRAHEGRRLVATARVLGRRTTMLPAVGSVSRLSASTGGRQERSWVSERVWLPWMEGIDRVIGRLSQLAGMWQSVRIRILALPDQEGSGSWRLHGAHFQLSPTSDHARLKARIADPLLLEGSLSIDQFIECVFDWSRGNASRVGDYSLLPPADISGTEWQTLAPEDPNSYPFLEALPEHQAGYRVDRLTAWSAPISGEVFNRLLQVITQTHPEENWTSWALAFMGMNWRLDAPYLLIQLPLCVGVDGRFDEAAGRPEVLITYRRPLRVGDFEVRIGAGPWDGSQEPIRPNTETSLDNGWILTTVGETEASASRWTGWVTLRGSRDPFQWAVQIWATEPETADRQRAAFLGAWYALANRRFSSDLAQLPSVPRGGQRTPDALEMALANACTSAGLQVLFGGSTLSTPGVDFVAFDELPATAYAVSVTSWNNVGKKLEEVLRVRQQIADALAPSWALVLVIASSDSRTQLRASAVADSAASGVTLLTAEDLTPLTTEPPDVEAWLQVLRSSRISRL